MQRIRVYANDRAGHPLAHSNIGVSIDGRLLGSVKDSRGFCDFIVSVPEGSTVPQIAVAVEFQANTYTRQLAASASILTINFDEIDLGRPYMEMLKQNLPAAVGLVLLAVSITLGFVFAHPEPTQIFLIRATFALGAGGVGSIIPGLLNLNANLGTKLGITAGGALAVLVLMYLFDPGDGSRASSNAPVSNATAPAGNATVPVGNIAAPAGNTTAPAGNGTAPADNATP